MDGAVSGADGEGLSAAIEFAVDAGGTERAFDGDLEAEADVAVVGASIEIGLEVAGDFEVDAAVTSVDIPGGADLGAGGGASVDAAIAGVNIEAIEAALKVNVAITAGGVDDAIEAAGLNVAVARMKTDIALGVLDGDAAVTGGDIDGAVDGFGFDGAIATAHGEVGILGHVNFDAQAGVMRTPIPERAAGSLGEDIDGIAGLLGADAEIVIELVAAVDDANFDLLDVAGGYAHGAVVGFDFDAGVTGDGEGLGDFFGLRGKSCAQGEERDRREAPNCPGR